MDRESLVMLYSAKLFVLSQVSFFHFMNRLAVPFHDCFLFTGLDFAPIPTTRESYTPCMRMPGGLRSANSVYSLQGLSSLFHYRHSLPYPIHLKLASFPCMTTLD